jgi:protein-disulfide isomerase
MNNLLKVGSKAPGFALNTAPGESLRLGDLSGKPVVLAFYPADWSPVCGDQLGLYNEALHKLEELDAQLIGISVDSEWCHKAYRETRQLRFPLLADFEPKGKISKLYNSYNDKRGASARTLYVIDAEGIICWNYSSPEDVNPGMSGFLQALRQLNGQSIICEDVALLNEGDHSRGSTIAHVTLLEFGDYECSHCRAAHDVVKQLLDHFELQVRYVFKNFPLTKIHPHAEAAAEAAESAAGLGNFWEMHDALFANQNDLRPESLLRYADSLGINTKQMAEDLKTHCYMPRVKSDFDSGIENGVNGTPAFFINGVRYDGSYNLEALSKAIELALAGENSTNSVSRMKEAV